jgi:hypothetical protein
MLERSADLDQLSKVINSLRLAELFDRVSDNHKEKIEISTSTKRVDLLHDDESNLLRNYIG